MSLDEAEIISDIFQTESRRKRQRAFISGTTTDDFLRRKLPIPYRHGPVDLI